MFAQIAKQLSLCDIAQVQVRVYFYIFNHNLVQNTQGVGKAAQCATRVRWRKLNYIRDNMRKLPLIGLDQNLPKQDQVQRTFETNSKCSTCI